VEWPEGMAGLWTGTYLAVDANLTDSKVKAGASATVRYDTTHANLISCHSIDILLEKSCIHTVILGRFILASRLPLAFIGRRMQFWRFLIGRF
jgi:hypothetical protein